jgi:putative Holliday junction resolvase
MNDDFYRVLGVDYGSVRIGLALSDPMRIIAKGYRTIPNNDHAVAEITNIVREENVKTIVVGMPFDLKGEIGSKGAEVEHFIAALRNAVSIEIKKYDERFTSVMAEKSLHEMGMTKKQRRNKGSIDEIASAILLQSYLDAQKNGR